jgi:hypothetical protein
VRHGDYAADASQYLRLDCNRSSGNLLQLQKHARKVRDLRHCGEYFQLAIRHTNSMKPLFHIANTTALRPLRRGPAACGQLHDECGKGFIPHD